MYDFFLLLITIQLKTDFVHFIQAKIIKQPKSFKTIFKLVWAEIFSKNLTQISEFLGVK